MMAIGLRFGVSQPRPPLGDKGAVAVLVALFMVVFLILAAFVVDFGRVYATKAQLQNAADAAALAAGGLLDCQTVGPAAARTAAETYAASNGVPLTGQTISFPTANQVTVRTAETVKMTFGQLAGVGTVNAVADATVTRVCSASFQLVANIWTILNGTGSNGEGIYGGQCFEGGGGTYGTVAVSSLVTFDCKTVKPTFGGQYPIYAGSGGTVTNPLYGVSGITTSSAWTAAGGPALQAAVVGGSPVTGDCKDVTGAQLTGGRNVNCTGAGNNGKLALVNGTIAGGIVAIGDITADNNTNLTGSIVYSINGSIVLKGNLGANTIVYAPNGEVTISGSNTVISGQIFANKITFSGGGQGAGDTTDLPIPGVWTLTE